MWCRCGTQRKICRGKSYRFVRLHLARGLEAPSYGLRRPCQCKIDNYGDWLLRRTAEFLGLSARPLLCEIRAVFTEAPKAMRKVWLFAVLACIAARMASIRAHRISIVNGL